MPLVPLPHLYCHLPCVQALKSKPRTAPSIALLVDPSPQRNFNHGSSPLPFENVPTTQASALLSASGQPGLFRARGGPRSSRSPLLPTGSTAQTHQSLTDGAAGRQKEKHMTEPRAVRPVSGAEDPPKQQILITCLDTETSGQGGCNPPASSSAADGIL
jgi:hypothetical protein